MEAGINVQAPETSTYTSLPYSLSLNRKPLPVEYVYINGAGKIVSGKKRIVVDPDNKGTGSRRTADVFVIPNDDPEVPPTIVYMMLNKEATWLKEFFEVGLVFQNMADPQFLIKDSAVKLKLPEGVSLAPTRKTRVFR
jgi:hypothetical protein